MSLANLWNRVLGRAASSLTWHALVAPKPLLCGWAILGLLLGAMGEARSDYIYWSDFGGGDIRRANLDGSGMTTLVSGLVNPRGPTLDLVGGKMYWGDNGSGDIRRANLDGSGQTILIRGLPGAGTPALDLASGQMYWSDDVSGEIRRANLDGTDQTTLVRGQNDPHAVVLDLLGGKMYWPEFGSGNIRRANLDGSELTKLVGGLPGPTLIALDLAGGKMYWTNQGSGDIRRGNLDGSGQEILVRNMNAPAGIALDLAGQKMYWGEYGGGDIRHANLDGTGQEILIKGLNRPGTITLDVSAPLPVLVTGFNADVISDKDPAARFAQPFPAGTFAWFESGTVDDEGAQHNDGLPAGLTLVSATGSRATYQIQPANAKNVLQLGAGQTGTLTLTTPAAYSTLYILASSGDGTPSSVGSGTINFADGGTQAFSYNSFDWCNGLGGVHPEAVLRGPSGRADVGPNGAAFVYNQDCDFQIYETVIAIDPLHAGVAIASIDFTGAPDAFLSSIFAVSGK
jgi:DNA-binding beta-propeller fold protein YncE